MWYIQIRADLNVPIMYQIHSRNTFVEHRTFLYDVQQVERIEFFHMMVVSRIDIAVNS